MLRLQKSRAAGDGASDGGDALLQPRRDVIGDALRAVGVIAAEDVEGVADRLVAGADFAVEGEAGLGVGRFASVEAAGFALGEGGGGDFDDVVEIDGDFGGGVVGFDGDSVGFRGAGLD